MDKRILFTFMLAVALSHACEGYAYDDPALTLAASCVGEAGWNAWETGECAAILHIYAKLAEQSGRSIDDIARAYSAAIKPRASHPSRWVLHMRADGSRPGHWPQGLRWDRYRGAWLATIDYVRAFLAGDVPDPLPNARHYGCVMDKPGRGLIKIKTGFRNLFYRLRRGRNETIARYSQTTNF